MVSSRRHDPGLSSAGLSACIPHPGCRSLVSGAVVRAYKRDFVGPCREANCLPWGKGRYGKFARRGLIPREFRLYDPWDHGNSCPWAFVVSPRAASWEQMLHHIGSDNPCRHSLSKRSAPRELQGRPLSVAGCRASFLIMSHLRSPRQLTLPLYKRTSLAKPHGSQEEKGARSALWPNRTHHLYPT